MASAGALSGVNLARKPGRHARTSGHHGACVAGSVEETKTTKKVDEPGGAVNPAGDSGSWKSVRTGIVGVAGTCRCGRARMRERMA